MATDLLFRAKTYLRYVLTARHKHGNGVHSPYVYDLVTKVIEESYPYYIYYYVEIVRKQLLADKSEIDVVDYGTRPSGRRRVCDIARRSLKSSVDAQLIFRLAYSMRPRKTVELGTSLGLTTAYLSKATERGVCHTFEGSEEIVKVASEVARRCGTGRNIEYHVGNIDETLPVFLEKEKDIDVVFIDANHSKEATLRYYRQLQGSMSKSGMIILDDIHSSSGMEAAWDEVKQDELSRVVIDMYGMGLVLLDENLTPGKYVLYV